MSTYLLPLFTLGLLLSDESGFNCLYNGQVRNKIPWQHWVLLLDNRLFLNINLLLNVLILNFTIMMEMEQLHRVGITGYAT